MKEIKFRYIKKYIVIFEASEEGYMYDIYENKTAYKNDKDSLDGGHCTGTLSDAIEMALDQA